MIDICVINYNTVDKLERFLASINQSNQLLWNLYVADNGSTDGSVEFLRENIDKYNITQGFFNENIGYAAASNQLASLGNSELLGIFNADVWLTPNYVQYIIDVFAAHPEMAIMGPKQRDERGQIVHAGIFGTNTAPKHRGWKEHDPHDARYRDFLPCVTISGSAYLVRRNVWEELTNCPIYQEHNPSVGAFLSTPHYYEETFCLTGDTTIWTVEGPKPIKDINIGDQVFCWDEDKQEIAIDDIIWSGSTGIKLIYETKFGRSSSIKATLDHNFLMARIDHNSVSGEMLGWLPITDGTHVVTGRNFSRINIEQDLPDGITEDSAKLFGAWIGDGSYNLDRQITFSIPEGTNVHEAYKELANRVLEGNSHINGRSFRVCSAKSFRWMHELGFVGSSSSKRLPKWIFSAPYRIKLAFLAGILDSDGHINKKGCLGLRLANKWLIEDIYLLCILVGLRPGAIRYEKRINYFSKPGPFHNPLHDHSKWSESWGFVIYFSKKMLEIPTEDTRYKERLNKQIAKTRSRKNDTLIGLPETLTSRKIISITPIGEEEVYDITTSKVGNFFANGILVHNCSYHARAHGYGVFYDGRAGSIGHSWHASSEVGGTADANFQISQGIFRKACANHGIPCD